MSGFSCSCFATQLRIGWSNTQENASATSRSDVRQALRRSKTRLVGDKVDTFIDFRLISRDGGWLVYDAVMDGASLVGSYHAQFASIIREASCAQLMERIKEKTLIVKLFEKSGS